MFRVIIVEDEEPIMQLNQFMLKQQGEFQVVASFTSSLEALSHIPELHADLILLDIEMPQMNGIELANRLVEIGVSIPMIYSTAYREYAIDAFRVSALDYVLKPMTVQKAERISQRLKKYYAVDTLLATGDLTQSVFVQISGKSKLFFESQEPVQWKSSEAEELFYYLFVNHDKLCLKSKIMADIWPMLPEDTANARLLETISLLRLVLSERESALRIERVSESYVLHIGEGVDSDLLKMEKFNAKLDGHMIADEASYTAAEKLWEKYEGRAFEGKGYEWTDVFADEYHLRWGALTDKLIEYAQEHLDDQAVDGFVQKIRRL